MYDEFAHALDVILRALSFCSQIYENELVRAYFYTSKIISIAEGFHS